jgi:hypothetical protein
MIVSGPVKRMGRVFHDRCRHLGMVGMDRDLAGLTSVSVHLMWHGVCRLSGFLAYLQSSRRLVTLLK